MKPNQHWFRTEILTMTYCNSLHVIRVITASEQHEVVTHSHGCNSSEKERKYGSVHYGLPTYLLGGLTSMWVGVNM